MANDLPQELIEAVLNDDPYANRDDPVAEYMKAEKMRGMATAGSPADIVNQRFPKLSWSGEEGTMAPALDTTPETDDEAYSGMDQIGLQHFWRNLPALTNETGAAAWMADKSGPYSQNIEDARNEAPMDVARDAMRWLSTSGLSGDQEDLSALSPQEYINRVIGAMHGNDFYQGSGAENYHLVPGMAPTDYDQADFYPTRKVSR